MGWSKTMEDNYEALCENLSVKGDDYNYTAWCYASTAPTKPESRTKSTAADNFAAMFKGESCFSF